MSLAASNVYSRLRPVLKTMLTVGTYMGCGDLLCQKIALKREKLEARRAFAFFTAGFTFSGLGNHFANTAAARLFPTTRTNDVLRRVMTTNLLFPITQSITFLSVMFWRDGNLKNWKTKVVKDLPQSYLISLFVLTPLSFMQGRFVNAYWRQWTAWIQGTFWNMWLSGLNLPNREYRTFDDYWRDGMARVYGSYAYSLVSRKEKKPKN
ncbi:integral membrane protein-like protein [Blastocystis sp. ATCC 50177/Nand II]|uniref:Integral membrane protein-like protein n=1 Tax=Blastocystis sp. subtype 1 (strain ATCC 50177 / NandII) TaxID=478820 RepID=A0A196SLZ0_BLAHN|nr:integral membrane protein-like protein [Blastocystis sp. ATCC 50177/Nand II]